MFLVFGCDFLFVFSFLIVFCIKKKYVKKVFGGGRSKMRNCVNMFLWLWGFRIEFIFLFFFRYFE